jgi:hypothetical protein
MFSALTTPHSARDKGNPGAACEIARETTSFRGIAFLHKKAESSNLHLMGQGYREWPIVLLRIVVRKKLGAFLVNLTNDVKSANAYPLHVGLR